MNKTATIIATAAFSASMSAWAGPATAMSPTPEKSSGSFLDTINSKGYGTFSGRIQLLGMYRDYEGVPAGEYGHQTTLGAMLGYVSPTWEGFTLGATYNYAGTLFDGGNTRLPLNDDIHLLNEAWISYNAAALGLEKTTLVVGRQIVNGEVFRKDDFRQKARGVEAAQLIVSEMENFTFSAGHAIRMSNWIQRDDRWDYNDFGDVFPVDYDTDGITWAEVSYTGIESLNVTIYDAYAWDVTNLIGTRIQYDICEGASVLGYYRSESEVGKSTTGNSDAWGLSLQQKVGRVTLEPGYLSVHGSSMLFNEATTGFNHALGSSMMIYSGQYNEGAKTAYLKATTKINNTVLYGLYNYTWHDHDKQEGAFNAQELNGVVKQIITDNFSVCVKAGVGYRDGKDGGGNTTATDARLFMTYTF